MVFHSRLQIVLFCLKAIFLKKKYRRKYINLHLTAIHLMKDSFSNYIFRQCGFENSFMHFLKTCYNGSELASVLISLLIIYCRESQYNG